MKNTTPNINLEAGKSPSNAAFAEKVYLLEDKYDDETDVKYVSSVPFDAEDLEVPDYSTLKVTDINLVPALIEVLKTKDCHWVHLLIADLHTTEFPQPVVEALNDEDFHFREIHLHTPKLQTLPATIINKLDKLINCYSLSGIENDLSNDDRGYRYHRNFEFKLENDSTKMPTADWLKEHLGVNTQAELEEVWAKNLNQLLTEVSKLDEVEASISLTFVNPIAGVWGQGIDFDTITLEYSDEATEVTPEQLASFTQVEKLLLSGKNLTKVAEVNQLTSLKGLAINSDNLTQIPTDLSQPNLKRVLVLDYDTNSYGLIRYIEDDSRLILEATDKNIVEMLHQANFGDKKIDLTLKDTAAVAFMEQPNLLANVVCASLELTDSHSVDLSKLTEIKELSLVIKETCNWNWQEDQEENSELTSEAENKDLTSTQTLVVPAQLVKFELENYSKTKYEFDYSKCSQLKELEVEDKYHQELALPANVCATLTSLELTNANLVADFPAPHLKSLNLKSSRRFIGEDPVQTFEAKLPEDLGVFANLEEFWIYMFIKDLPKSIGKLVNLKRLYIRTPGFTNNEEDLIPLTSLPAEFKELENLNHLVINGTNLETFSLEILGLPSLTQVNLEDNPKLDLGIISKIFSNKDEESRRLFLSFSDCDLNLSSR